MLKTLIATGVVAAGLTLLGGAAGAETAGKTAMDPVNACYNVPPGYYPPAWCNNYPVTTYPPPVYYQPAPYNYGWDRWHHGYGWNHHR